MTMSHTGWRRTSTFPLAASAGAPSNLMGQSGGRSRESQVLLPDSVRPVTAARGKDGYGPWQRDSHAGRRDGYGPWREMGVQRGKMDPVSGWWLQALGLCLGTVVTPLLLSSFVGWAMAPTQLCRSGSTRVGACPAKSVEDPRNPQE